MNIYVGNLDFKVNEAELRDLFTPFGAIGSVKIITDKFTGKSKGFGFVDIDNATEAANAIEELNGSTLAGKKIIVNEAKPRRTNY